MVLLEFFKSKANLETDIYFWQCGDTICFYTVGKVRKKLNVIESLDHEILISSN